MAPRFVTPRIPGTCADCGKRIFDLEANQDIEYHRTYFSLSDGTVAFVSFCLADVVKPWTPQRLGQLEAQCHRGWAAEPKNAGWSAKGLKMLGRDFSYPIQKWNKAELK